MSIKTDVAFIDVGKSNKPILGSDSDTRVNVGRVIGVVTLGGENVVAGTGPGLGTICSGRGTPAM